MSAPTSHNAALENWEREIHLRTLYKCGCETGTVQAIRNPNQLLARTSRRIPPPRKGVESNHIASQPITEWCLPFDVRRLAAEDYILTIPVRDSRTGAHAAPSVCGAVTGERCARFTLEVPSNRIRHSDKTTPATCSPRHVCG